MILARRLAIASVTSTILLIAAGVVVRATGSGLGCPDWPTCHGGLLPPGEKHPVIEVTHRFIAIAVGLLVIGLAVVCWRTFRHRPLIWILAAAVVPTVGVQGVLGAITVVKELPPAIVATHLLTAFLILGALIILVIEIQYEIEGHRQQPPVRATSLGALALIMMAVLALVVWIGGYLPESGASSACPAWPACRGWSFAAGDSQELTHMLHRYAVLGLAVTQVWLSVAAFRSRGVFRWSGPLVIGLLSLLIVQILLGALNVWYEFPNALAVSHTVVASLIWAIATAIVVLALRPGAGTAPSGHSP